MSVNLARGYDPTLALTGGRWVTVRGIRRWVGKRPADDPEVPMDPNIVCTYCGAKYWEACKTPNGSACRSHRVRTRPRACLCGGEVVGTNNNCDACQKANAARGRKSPLRIRVGPDRKCPHGHAQHVGKAGVLLACKSCKRNRNRNQKAKVLREEMEESNAA